MARADRRNRAVALVVTSVVAGMVGLSFAAVPLYQLFCQITGYGGATQVGVNSQSAPILARRMQVSFDSNVSPNLAWQFRPLQKDVTVRLGEEKLVFYEAKNLSDAPITGTATFNVTPFKAGQYFVKVECFCFQEQTLEPGQTVQMPVSFFVDPSLAEDKNAYDLEAITLSYTFFSVPEKKAKEKSKDKDKEKVIGSGHPAGGSIQIPDKS
ncbi:MAG: cytochrome c oxidase assembly protein [Rhodospirillales bacterium]